MDDSRYMELMQRIDELETRLQCVGDDITISVDQTSGGQIIQSLYEEPAEVDDTKNYVNVSYDSSALEFTVTVTDLPVVWLNGFLRGSPLYDITIHQFPQNNTTTTTVVSKTFTFDKPATNTPLKLYVAPLKDQVNGDNIYGNIYWSGILTGSDSTTKVKQIEDTKGSVFYTVTLGSDGTHAVTENLIDSPAIGGYSYDPCYFLVNPNTRKIYLYNHADPILLTDGVSGNGHSYTEPFNTYMILGWNAGDITMTLDENVNSGNYDSYTIVGYVNINSDNEVLACEVIDLSSKTLVPHWGYTGTAAASATLKIRNGSIVNVT